MLQCDNERPKCRKCLDTGRECAGYTREMVFITSGPELQGRVSSHPRRQPATSSSSKKARTEEEKEEKLELVPAEPLVPAWDDLMTLSSRGVVYLVQIAALHTTLQKILRGTDDGDGINFNISLPKYAPVDITPNGEDIEFIANTQCIVTLSSPQKEDELTDSYCVFLYEVRALREIR